MCGKLFGIDHRFVRVRRISLQRDSDQISQGPRCEHADLAFAAQGSCGCSRSHRQNLLGRKLGKRQRQGMHLFEQVQGIVAGQAISAQADIDAVGQKQLQGSDITIKKTVTLGTMDDVGARFSDQLKVTAGWMIDVRQQTPWPEHSPVCQQLKNALVFTVRHVAALSLEIIEHVALAAAKHIIFFDRLRQVGSKHATTGRGGS